MKFLNILQERLASFEKKEIVRFGFIYLAVCVVTVAGIIGYYVYSLQEMKGKIALLNKSRNSIQTIFTQYQVVKQQKNKVDEALKQNSKFNIVRFFQDIIQKKSLTNQTTTKVSRQQLPNGYLEENLQIVINQIDTKIMCEILYEIQQESIVYIVSIDVTKPNFVKKINLSMAIATLRAEEQST
ncbi:hypothetical protein HYV10_00355 [Candidatus Dependentiae bacterium]|nr:hypothetical protein [Candidatus Dependentiae bacterium]